MAGIAGQILVIGHITDRTIGMTRTGTRTIIGMTGITSLLHTVTRSIDMLVVRGAQRRTATGGNAGRAVLMAGTTGTGSSNIPVRGRGAMTDNRTGPARLGIVSAGRNTREDDFS